MHAKEWSGTAATGADNARMHIAVAKALINQADCRKSRLCYSSPHFELCRRIHLMAAQKTDYQPGSMDISQHQRAYAGFSDLHQIVAAGSSS